MEEDMPGDADHMVGGAYEGAEVFGPPSAQRSLDCS